MEQLYSYLGGTGLCEARPEDECGGVREILCIGEPDAAGTVRLVIYCRDGTADVASSKTRNELHGFHRDLMRDLLPGAELRLPILERAADVNAYFAVLIASDAPWPQLALQFVRRNATSAAGRPRPPAPTRRPAAAAPPAPRQRTAADVAADVAVDVDAPPPPPAAAAAAAEPRPPPPAFVLRRSRDAWFGRVYAPVAALSGAWCLLLTALGVVTPADWSRGACGLAILTAPLVCTIGLAVGAAFLDGGEILEEPG